MHPASQTQHTEGGSISGRNHRSGTTHTSGYGAASSRSLGPRVASSSSQPGASPPRAEAPSPRATSLRSCKEGPSLLIVTPCPPGPAPSIWTCPLPSPLPGTGRAPASTRGEVTVPTTVPVPCFPGPCSPSGPCHSSVSGRSRGDRRPGRGRHAWPGHWASACVWVCREGDRHPLRAIRHQSGPE